MIVRVHREIVRAALGGVLAPSALRVVATANARCDLYQWQPERHFDNGRDVAALGALWRRGLHGYLVRCVECCAPVDTARRRPRGRRGALVALGMATHALADFYAHTSWIELLGPNAPTAPLLGDAWPAAALPPDLHSGYFSLRHGLAGCPRRDGAYMPPHGFRACHATLNKDAPDRGHGAERMAPGGPTYHEVAVRLATAATRELWEALRVRLDAAYERGDALLIALSAARV